MAKNIQAIRGMHDILPGQSPLWQWVEQRAREVLDAYGYREIRMPLLEKTELFERSIGEVTDIVEKEMYTFEDRNGDSLTLRPEGTASCVRAGIEHGLLHNQQQRLWYAGPMFRHERPQRGRYRQFHQIGAEAFGMAGPDIDAELIVLSARLWRALGIDGLVLELNTLGDLAERNAYRRELVDYFGRHRAALDADSLRRLETNPLRILDSKEPQMRALIEGAPRLTDHLQEPSRAHFEGLTDLLTQAGIAYRINSRLVRGLDYYSHTVFEWVTDRLGAQGTVCAGGRYDALVEQLGGRATPAAGFALGMERLIALLEGAAGFEAPQRMPHVFVATAGAAAARRGFVLAEELRDALPGLRVQLNCGGGSLKAQMKRADRCGARVTLILGDDEIAAGTAVLKDLREDTAQVSVVQGELPARLRALLDGEGAA